ncbi:MAG: choice-of-anchor S family protein [Candidatus Heimdallarchaeota archaeon]
MKKILKITIPLFIIAMFLGTTMVRADFNVTVGSSKAYDVVTSNWTVAAGANSGGGTGLQVEGVGYNEDEVITVEVTAETSSSVDYDLTIDVDTYGYVSNGLGNIFFFAFTILLPLMMPLMVGGTWVQAEVDMGPGFWGDFFLDSDMTEAMYEFANNETALAEITNDPDNTDITFKKFEGVFKNSTDIAVFDWACDFDMKNTSTNTDYSGKYRYKIAFDQTTSWVKGWRLFLDYNGTFEGSILEVEWNQLIQQQGYALGNFTIEINDDTITTVPITTALSPGFEWFLLFPALGLLALPVIIKRRK